MTDDLDDLKRLMAEATPARVPLLQPGPRPFGQEYAPC